MDIYSLMHKWVGYQVDSQKKKRLKEIVEKHYNNPDELARLLAEEYGMSTQNCKVLVVEKEPILKR